jgi:hypothetical protein
VLDNQEGVDPVELRENPRPAAKNLFFSKVKDIKKVPKYSRHDVGVDPDAIGRTPSPLLLRSENFYFSSFKP